LPISALADLNQAIEIVVNGAMSSRGRPKWN